MILGTIVGFQFSNDTFSSCLYSTIDTMNYIQNFENDWYNLIDNYNVYSLFVYDPTHFYINLVATYEYCNVGLLWDILSNIMNLNYAFLADVSTRVTVAFIDGSITTDINGIQYYTSKVINYYQAGIYLGYLLKIFLDWNLNTT